jgi:hypothetical protein
MASVSVLFTRRKGPLTKFQSDLGEIVLDATISVSPDFTSTVAQHPVEDGPNISDHISLDPEKVSLEGFITDSPIRILSGVRDIFEASTSRVQTAYDALRELRESRRPFTLVTGFEVFEDMFFTRLSFPRDRSTGQALRFTAECQKLRIVVPKTVSIPAENVSEELSDQSQSRRDVGKQVPSTASGVTEQNSTILHRLLSGTIY